MNGDSAFTASNGWLDRWKKRHGIRHLSISREKLSADTASAEEYLSEFGGLVSSENYSSQQIYNADESGLNFKALPTKSLAFQEESSAPSSKMNKQRLTVLACSNAAGSNKLPSRIKISSRTMRRSLECMGLQATVKCV
ncbi:Tc5 transposase DNA-binding domain [Popillia japonica]|uniref:Tc5 transposase DNA-binding domain n=1 Tax=Popillia japonica TaxID=7064 RepID=A0AAW1ID10_POPJA